MTANSDQHHYYPLQQELSPFYLSTTSINSTIAPQYPYQTSAPPSIVIPSPANALISHDSEAFDNLKRPLSPEEAVKQVILMVQRKAQHHAANPKLNESERSRRYRQRRQAYIRNLERLIQQLRQQNQQLQFQRDRLVLQQECAFSSPFTTSPSTVQFVHEYYDIFRHGMRPRQLEDGSVLTTANQRAYLDWLVDPNLLAFEGKFRGMHAMVEQWTMYTTFHASLHMELHSATLKMVDNCSIVSTTSVSHLGYSRKTLQKLFPHILGQHEEIAQKLIGQVVSVPFTDHFYFDHKGKLCRYDLMPDFATGLLNVLGDLQEVAIVLGHAQVEHGALIDVLEEEEKMEKQSRIEIVEKEEENQQKLGQTPSPANNSAMGMEFILS